MDGNAASTEMAASVDGVDVVEEIVEEFTQVTIASAKPGKHRHDDVVRCAPTPFFIVGTPEAVPRREAPFDAVLGIGDSFCEDLRAFLPTVEFGPGCIEVGLHGLTSSERKRAHVIAEDLGLLHFSCRDGRKQRVLYISDRSSLSGPSGTLYDCIVARAYIGVEGPRVQACGERHVSSIPASWAKARGTRDGPLYHITLIGKNELRGLAQAEGVDVDVVIDRILEACRRVVHDNGNCTWQDQGMGTVTQDGNACAYRILDWPLGDRIRAELGLPRADFHITLGFQPNDVHDGPRKDIHSLVPDDHFAVDA
ncbi:Uncharacterized protein PBTT_04855 [Plasmodiophora brassicae]|uniref:Swiss Army Knife 2H phosphoesterase domain-containing protein n=1 Tax=Plasmodiophora brassicae TaxID=37360 RepID=A0A0G4IRD2_PLABS|nr:hypothetical protein PBRA_005866 [Plasmodiophora brassicae]